MNTNILFLAPLFSSLLALSAQAYEVVLPAKPTEAEGTAASELKDYLAKTATAVVSGKLKETRILVGPSPEAMEAGLDPSKMEEEAWVIKEISPGTLVILGGGERGTLYGAYHFIEEILGVRFFTPFDEYLPNPRKVSVQGLSLGGKPFFESRSIYRTHFPNDDGRFLARRRLNDGVYPTMAFGGGFKFGSPGMVHTIEKGHPAGYLPYGDYLSKHPEYFSLVDGKRAGGEFTGQLCLTNTELPGLFSKKLKDYILIDEARVAQEPDKFLPPRYYEIGVNDNYNACQCEQCKAAMAQGKNQTDLLLDLLNPLARELKTFRPDVRLTSLAYLASEAPPKQTVPETNLSIRLCNTSGHLLDPVTTERNKPFLDYLKSWGNVTPNLMLWEYATNFNAVGIPLPQEFTFGPNMRYFASQKWVGMFLEMEYPDITDMFDLKYYLYSKLAENPHLDAEAVMNDFYKKFYGPAGKHVKAYRQRLRQAALDYPFTKPLVFTTQASEFGFIDLNTMDESQELMDKAEEAVRNDPARLRRVRDARLSLDYAYSYGRQLDYQLASADAGVEPPVYQAKLAEVRKRFIANWETRRSRYVNVDKNHHLNFATIKASCLSAPPVPEFFKGMKVLQYLGAGNWPVPVETIYKEAGYRSPELIEADTPSGFAYRFSADVDPKGHQKGDQIVGFQDPTAKKTLSTPVPVAEMRKGFQWFKIPNFELRNPGYIFATKSWMPQMPLGGTLLLNRKLDVYVQMKCSGPVFGDESQKESYLYYGDVVIVEATPTK